MTVEVLGTGRRECILREAQEAMASARAAGLRAQVLMRESHRLRWPTEISWPRMFVVRGVVEGRTVRAVWSRGSLVCSSALLRRGELLVAMGEEFGLEPGGPVLGAGFDDPAAAMLTLMRACDQVNAVQFSPVLGPAGGEGSGHPGTGAHERCPFRLLSSKGAVSVLGEIDRSCAASFRRSAMQAMGDLEWAVLDLGGLRFVDSDGALALAAVLRSTGAVTRNVPSALRKIWEILDLEMGLLA